MYCVECDTVQFPLFPMLSLYSVTKLYNILNFVHLIETSFTGREMNPEKNGFKTNIFNVGQDGPGRQTRVMMAVSPGLRFESRS